MNGKDIRVLWFANTPGLSQNYFNAKSTAGGWISSLQAEIEKSENCKLGYVFYTDRQIEPFEFNGTHYFPVQRLGSHKRKRLLHRVIVKTEYDENLQQFIRIIETFRPDIINVHGTENSFGLILNHITHIPVVITIQGNLTVYTRKYFSGISMPGFFTQLMAGNPFFKSDYKLFAKRSAIEREILKRAGYVIGRTDWDRRVCRVLAPGAKYFHVEEIMRPGFYQHKWQPADNKPPVFFTTSSHSFYKGLETLFETAALLVKNNFAFTWLVAGLHENDPLVQLTKKACGIKGLQQFNIKLLGQLPEEILSEKMAGADVYVQVSHIENSPNSICEAMLLGMPIVASFAGGTSSLIKDKVTGTLVQDGDPYALAGALIEICGDRDYAKNIASEAYKEAHKRHNGKEIARSLLNVYNSIIKNHNGSFTS